MRTGLWLLTIVFILVGFFFPAAWLAAEATAALALIGSFGAGVGNLVHHAATQQCPYCKKRVPHTAQKCSYCGEWLTARTA